MFQFSYLKNMVQKESNETVRVIARNRIAYNLNVVIHSTNRGNTAYFQKNALICSPFLLWVFFVAAVCRWRVPRRERIYRRRLLLILYTESCSLRTDRTHEQMAHRIYLTLRKVNRTLPIKTSSSFSLSSTQLIT